MLVPSASLDAPSLPATASPLTWAFEAVVAGGHAAAQDPEHVLVEPLSPSNRYSVRPCASTSTVPSAVCRVPIVAGADAAAAAVLVGFGAEYDVPDVEPPHAA